MNRIIHFEHPRPTAKVKSHSYNDTDYYTDIEEVNTPFFLDEYKQDINAVIRLIARYIVPYLIVICYSSSVPVYLMLSVHFFVNQVYIIGVFFMLLLIAITAGFIFWLYLAKNRIYYK